MMNNNKMQHMWMWYHSEINDTVLFKNWHITTINGMIVACVIFACLGILLEIIKWIRWRLDISYEEKLEKNNVQTFYLRIFNKLNIIKTLLLTIQMIISYMLMLVFMTFSLWLCLSVTIGLSIGYFLFGNRAFNLPDKKILLTKRKNETQNSCCNEHF